MGLGLTNQLILDVFSSAEMRACFDDRATLQGWLDAERALSKAQADLGEIPAQAAEIIAENCVASEYSLPELANKILATGHPLVPVIRTLVTKSGDAGKFAHWGATTQDIVDTGLTLQCRNGLRILQRDLREILQHLIVHARKYRDVPTAGRTHFQHAAPITFGYKVAIWIDDLTRVLARIDHVQETLTGQFAGAVGTLSSLDGKGFETRDAMCAKLGLKSAPVPWHTTRDRFRDIVNALLELSSAAERIGIEIVLLQATELQEASEPISEHHVGSSTMPQKRNPHTSEFMVTGARMMRGIAMPLVAFSAHSHEREMTAWALEWIAFPEIFALASGVCTNLRAISKGLIASPENMAKVLDLTRGQIMSESVMMKLARHVGHEEAHEIIYRCASEAGKSGRDIGEILKSDRRILAHLSDTEIDAALDPASYLGDSMKIVDVAVASAEQVLASRGADRT